MQIKMCLSVCAWGCLDTACGLDWEMEGSLCYAKLLKILGLNSVIPNKDFLSPFLLLQWLNEAKIIQRLVELIHSSQDEDVSITRLSLVFVGRGSCKLQKTLFVSSRTPRWLMEGGHEGWCVWVDILSSACSKPKRFVVFLISFWLILLPISQLVLLLHHFVSVFTGTWFQVGTCFWNWLLKNLLNKPVCFNFQFFLVSRLQNLHDAVVWAFKKEMLLNIVCCIFLFAFNDFH